MKPSQSHDRHHFLLAETLTCAYVCVYSPVQSQDTPSLQNVSLSVGSGQLVAVIGPEGAGKVRALPSIQIFVEFRICTLDFVNFSILNLSFFLKGPMVCYFMDALIYVHINLK